MKLSETILNKRKALGMTQEQVADRLGVSASAVHKWERGLSLPDITLLAPLARLLEMDLNTLLSFQEDLTEQEVDRLIREITQTVMEKGFAEGFQAARRLIQEYPNCQELIFGLASSLQGLMLLTPEGVEQGEEYEEEICKLYQGLADTAEEPLREKVKEMLFYYYVNRKEYEKAEEVLKEMSPEGKAYNQAKATLYMRQENYAQAREVLEQQLLAAAGSVQSALSGLQVIALQEENLEEAGFLADTGSSIVRTLQLWEYGAYSTYLELYCKKKDVAGCIRIFEGMFANADKPWDLSATTLYRHMPAKTQDNLLPGIMRADLLDLLEHEEALAFFRESVEGKNFIEKIKKQNDPE